MATRTNLSFGIVVFIYAATYAVYSESTVLKSQAGVNADRLNGTNLLAVGGFWIFDARDKTKTWFEAVEGQMCHFARGRGVNVYVIMPHRAEAPTSWAARKAFAPCLKKYVSCAGNLKSCYKEHFADEDIVFDAIYSRDDELIVETHQLQIELGLPSLFDRESWLEPGDEEKVSTKALSAAMMPDRTLHLPSDCTMPSATELPESKFPGFLKYQFGVHASNGWGGQCLREVSRVGSRAEMERKLPFFCGKGMRSYHFLQSEEQRQLFFVPLHFGHELNAEVVVYHGVPVVKSFRGGMYSCNGTMLMTFPGVAPQWEETGRSMCEAQIVAAVEHAKVWNHVVGIQLMYDWRDGGSCGFIEINLRPHDWAIIADPTFNIQHVSDNTYFDFGAVTLYLAFDLDPSGLMFSAPPEFTSAAVAICKVTAPNVDKVAGFHSMKNFVAGYSTDDCSMIVGPTPQNVLERSIKLWPCLGGPPRHLDVGKALKTLCLAEFEDDGAFFWVKEEKLRKDMLALKAAPGEEDYVPEPVSWFSRAKVPDKDSDHDDDDYYVDEDPYDAYTHSEDEL